MLALIGGSALYSLQQSSTRSEQPSTPFGTPIAPIEFVTFGSTDAVFLPRHGQNHGVVAHNVNYRANIWALKELGVDAIVAYCTVGGITRSLSVGQFVAPTQIIDYTYGRGHSFEEHSPEPHFDFTEPFTSEIRSTILAGAKHIGLDVLPEGAYGCMQGPRFETAAEIDRLDRDGCTLVGMTLMPEASLARELQIPYAAICCVVNMAAGRGSEEVSMDDVTAVGRRAGQQVESLFAHIASDFG